MRRELERLKAELEKVRSSSLEYLPDYGYSPKEEIIGLILEDIAAVEAEMQLAEPGCTPEELEDERMRLCILQGIPRYAY